MSATATKPTCLSEAWEDQAAVLPAPAMQDHAALLQRTFYAGALMALVLAADQPARERLRGEAIDFGRSIGRR